jgi:hypothetical protein
MAKYMGVTIEGGGSSGLGFIEGGLEADAITELYTAAAGANGLVDVNNTTSLYYPTTDVYGEGVVQTERLYDSATAITSLLVNEMTSLFVGTRGTVDVSFDDGNSWSTATNNIGDTITSFTGTSDDGGVYKLKLKFTLGSTYLESGAYGWTTTSSLNLARRGLVGCGTTAAALSFGGESSGGLTDRTEIWSGSVWSTTTNYLAENGYLSGCGTTSAALGVGGAEGAAVNTTDIWLLSSWATTTVLTEAKRSTASSGTTTAALCIGGYTPPPVNTTEKWLLSSWVTTTDLSEIKESPGGCGTTAAALCVGGTTDGGTTTLNTTEIWLLSSWATTTDLLAFKYHAPACGTTAAALSIGGLTGSNYITTEIWNGSIWATTTDLTVARGQGAGFGTILDALVCGGVAPGVTNTCERWINTGIQRGFSAKIN